MRKIKKQKKGFTLVEVMAVVVIIGILSALGYAGLQDAVANNRIKDAAYNISAFMERVSNETRRLNDTLCVLKTSDQKLIVYQSSCTADRENAKKLDSLVLDAPVKILQNADASDLDGENFAVQGAEFVPRIGLSAAPLSGGFFEVQYGSKNLFGASEKKVSNNMFLTKIKYSQSASWQDL